MAIKIDDAIGAYLKLRKQLEDLKKEHKLAEAAIASKMETFEAYFLNHLNTTGTDSVAARGVGTVFKQDSVACTVKDWEATLDWIRRHEAWEFLEHRVAKTVVQEFAISRNELPPGVEMTTRTEVRVRSA